MVPLVVVSSIDPVLPQVIASGLLCDVADLTVVRHEIHAAGHRLRRVVTRADRLQEDVSVPLGAHLPVLRVAGGHRADRGAGRGRGTGGDRAGAARDGRPGAGRTRAGPAARGRRADPGQRDRRRRPPLRVGPARGRPARRSGLAFTAEDRRSVGEALARQVGERRRDRAVRRPGRARGRPARPPRRRRAEAGRAARGESGRRARLRHALLLDRARGSRPGPTDRGRGPGAGSGRWTCTPGGRSTRSVCSIRSSGSGPVRSGPGATSGCPPAPG